MQPSRDTGSALLPPLSGIDEPYGALYIHIPFCKSRCAYCDFHTQAMRADDPRIDAYFEDLVRAVRRAGTSGALGSVRSVYIGGGTPTHAGSRRLSQLLYTLSLSMHLTSEVECTIEANPESITLPMVKDLWALGANRLSIGVQSFDDGVLRQAGRAHTSDQAKRAIEWAHERFSNVSIDLICGLPGHRREVFCADVGQAIAAGVSHASIYPLMVEEGTPLAARVDACQVEVWSDDEQADCMVEAQRMLAQAGFERYEVASYATPGNACRHNIAYWIGVPYLGLGCGAVSMYHEGGSRIRVRDGAVEDRIAADEALAEDLMLGMRMSAGVSCSDMGAAGLVFEQLDDVLCRLQRDGLLELRDGRWRPTQRGWLCGNDLYTPLLFLT